MKRQKAVETSLSGSASDPFDDASFEFRRNFHEDVVVERDAPGQPHKGKVLMLVMAHADDHSGTGTAAKLIQEGYTGYFVRVTNEDKSLSGHSVGEAVELIADDTEGVGKAIGCKKTYNLGYSKHDMEDISIQELRGRFIFLFRLLKVDTVITFDPWSHYEENPDHYWTGRAIEAARWHASMGKDYPEHFRAGLKPHGPKEMYYFSRGPNLSHYNFTQFNRVVDIGSAIEKKINADIANKHWGLGSSRDPEDIRKRYLSGGRRREIAKRFGLDYAEFFNYMSGP